VEMLFTTPAMTRTRFPSHPMYRRDTDVNGIQPIRIKSATSVCWGTHRTAEL